MTTLAVKVGKRGAPRASTLIEAAAASESQPSEVKMQEDGSSRGATWRAFGTSPSAAGNKVSVAFTLDVFTPIARASQRTGAALGRQAPVGVFRHDRHLPCVASLALPSGTVLPERRHTLFRARVVVSAVVAEARARRARAIFRLLPVDCAGQADGILCRARLAHASVRPHSAEARIAKLAILSTRPVKSSCYLGLFCS